jgi:hypothetical protein
VDISPDVKTASIRYIPVRTFKDNEIVQRVITDQSTVNQRKEQST